MKHFINFVFRYFLPILGILLALLRFFFPDFIIYFYGWAYLNWILAAIILLLIILSFYGWYSSGRERSKEFKKNFPVYKIISELEPSDFGIFKYYETYIHRESDTQVDESFEKNGIAFITGKPRIGKTRGAFEVAKKFKDFYILKPANEKIDIQNLKFPHLFSPKKIILFLDDLEKYAGKFGLDELIAVLKKNCKDLKVLATCRTGKEFEQAFGQKEMAVLLSQCKTNKVEPRILNKKEEKELAKGIGRKWEDVTTDGTPGSIVLGLDQMEKRYKDLEDEPKTILHILKLLREANIFFWADELVKNIAKSRIFELKSERYQWDNWLKVLQDNGFIQKSESKINISHDFYLDNKFITDYQISDSILIELKDELFALKEVENLIYLGNSFYERKNVKESINCNNKSIKINPDHFGAHNNLGLLLSDLENYTEAEKEYRVAIKINPNYADAHYNLGILLDDLKNYPEAEKEYRAAIKINPAHAQAHGNLGLLYIEIGRTEEARKELLKAKELFMKQGREEDVTRIEDILKDLE